MNAFNPAVLVRPLLVPVLVLVSEDVADDAIDDESDDADSMDMVAGDDESEAELSWTAIPRSISLYVTPSRDGDACRLFSPATPAVNMILFGLMSR
eukprot:COSAG05_NODE_7171_length_847_cov_1.053476_2_plen_96_part_00